MRNVNIPEENLMPLAEIISNLIGTPQDRIAGFAVVVATYEEDEKPSGRLIASTPSLRAVGMMLDVAREEINVELAKLSGLS